MYYVCVYSVFVAFIPTIRSDVLWYSVHVFEANPYTINTTQIEFISCIYLVPNIISLTRAEKQRKVHGLLQSVNLSLFCDVPQEYLL